MVVMLGPGVTVSVSGGLLADVGVLSVTVMTTVVEVVALADRGPVMAPVLGLNVSPAGKPVIDHVYGGEPPVALGDALYAAPASPAGNEFVNTTSAGGAIVIEKPCVAVAIPSVTCAVNGKMPTVVGEPGPILPSGWSVRGGGSEPEPLASDQV